MGLSSNLNISINISYSQIFVLIALKVVLMEVSEGKDINTTYGASVLPPSVKMDLGALAPCAHIEADTRFMVHALDATSRRH